MTPPLISRPERIPDLLIILRIDNMQLTKGALSDLNSYSLLDCHSRISDRLSPQNVKTDVRPIKMEKHEQRSVIKFFFLQGRRSKAIHGELSRVLGEAAVSLATVKRWCRRLTEGDSSLDDEFRSGRPRSDLGEAVSQFLDKEPFLSARILAKRLATNPHTIKEILTRDLGLRKFTRRWVPHNLSPANKAKRVTDARMLLQALTKDQDQNFSHIMTGDESWFYYAYESPTMFAPSRDEVIPRVSPTIGSKKVMITIFFTGNRLLKLAYLPQGQKYNQEYFINEILEGINQECNRGAGYRVTKTMKIHMDNCRVHNALETSRAIGRMKIERLVQPPYSPDLSPCDFWFFGRAKTALQNRRFANADEVIEALTNLWDSVTFEELHSVFLNWIERLEWVIRHSGEYFTK